MRAVKLSPERGETATSLLQQSLTAPHPRLRERLLALALIADGQPAKHVARQLGRSRGTVEDWVRRFNAQGLAGLRPTFRGQPGTRLTPTELTQLRATVQRSPRQAGLKTGTWTGKAVAAFAKRAFGKAISAATARRYLHRLGFGRKRPRKRFVRAKPAAQRAFAQALQQVEQQREPGSVTVYMDQGQIWQDVLPRLGWFLRGQPAEVPTTSPAKAAKVLFYVAVVRPVGRVITMLCPWFSQEMTAKFLAKLRRRLGKGRVDVVLDNAPHHQGPIVEEALTRYQIVAHRLPPYSPEMNAAEAWIRWAKEDLSANICWQERGALIRSFIGFVASMAKRVPTVLHRCVPQMYGFSCA
jgi:putative transposase